MSIQSQIRMNDATKSVLHEVLSPDVLTQDLSGARNMHIC